MTQPVIVHLNLADGPNSLSFEETYSDLEKIGIAFRRLERQRELWANADGCEHLGRYVLKLTRGIRSIMRITRSSLASPPHTENMRIRVY